MSVATKCECRGSGDYDLVDDDNGFPQKVHGFVRCDWCKKRDEQEDAYLAAIENLSAQLMQTEAEVKRIDRAYKKEVERCDRAVNKAERLKDDVATIRKSYDLALAEVERLKEENADLLVALKHKPTADERGRRLEAEVGRLKTELGSDIRHSSLRWAIRLAAAEAVCDGYLHPSRDPEQMKKLIKAWQEVNDDA